MKPKFESPIHTAGDLVERNITLYTVPGNQLWRQLLSQSDFPEYRKIAETTVIPKDWPEWDEITQQELLGQGTHALIASYLEPEMLSWGTDFDQDQGRYNYNFGRGYYRGERVMTAAVVPETGYLSNKKWHLNEVGR